MSSTRSRTLARTALAGAAALAATDAAAAGFQLREGSAAAQGMSLAGRASFARDVSFVLGNPAALRAVEGFEVTQGLAGVLLESDGTVQGDPATVTGNPKGDAGLIAAVPSLAVGWRLNDEVVLGLTVDSPFGLGNSYDNDWAGGADGLDSELLTVAVTPMVSIQPIPHFAVAGGLTVQYADARLSRIVANGEEADLTGDDIAFGFIVGAAWDPFPGTSLGIRYRSGIEHALEGEFSENYLLSTGPDVNAAGPGVANLPLPASLNFGFVQAIDDDWRIMAEAEFTEWSTYDEITISGDNVPPAINPLVETVRYKNSWMAALGFEHDWSDSLTLRSGVAIDLTPTRDEFRRTSVPDNDRFWWSAGFSYEISDRIGIDAAYTFIAVPESGTVTLQGGPNAGRRVEYDTSIHVIGINGRFRF